MEIVVNNFKTECEKKTVSIALGLFDSVHIAHQEIIKQAKQKSLNLGGLTAVLTFSLGDNTQIKPMNKQNIKLILSNERRLEKFEELGADIVYIPDFYNIKNLSPEDFFYDILLKQCKVGTITCGYDYRFGSGGLGDTTLLARLCKANDIDLTIIEQQKLEKQTVSSSLIRELLSNGDIEKANAFLGYNYSTKYEVVKGNQIGRTIGFNTANQILDETLIIPRYGVYKTTTTLRGKQYPSISSIGVKPTFDGVHGPLAETHIFNFDEDIYGEVITVEYHEFIRGEQKFDSIDELQAQIQKDVDKCNI